jgi:hypothetical protein
MTNTVRVPLPQRGDGYRVIRGMDGKMTTVPLTGADMALYRPMLAMDAAIGGPPGSPNYRGYNSTAPTNTPRPAAGSATGDDDLDDINPAADDTEDQVRQLLEGKLDQADIDALCNLIFPDEEAPMPAQDRRGRRGRQAHDSQRLALDALIRQRVAESGTRRAAIAQKQYADLMQRFPALKSARVVG